jgi:signal transduction histidine kinase
MAAQPTDPDDSLASTTASSLEHPSTAIAPGSFATPPGEADSFAQGGGECGALIRAFDWSTTCLGPIARWPQSTKTSVSTMLRSPYPITMFWGRDLTMLYNDAFRPIHGEKHPGTIGASAPQALAEAWSVLGPLVAKTLASGEPLFVENGAVFFARRPGGLREETYFTWSYNPTIGETGGIAGLFAIASETTRQVIGDRRLATLRELSLRTAYDRSVEGIFATVEEVLAQADADLPFALLYVVEHGAPRLVSCAGVARGSAAAPAAPALTEPWPLAAAIQGQAVVLEDLGATLGPLPGGRWPEPATRALVLPVPIADAEVTGVLIAGVSPLRPLDDEYRSFLELLARQISASISSARAHEQQTQRAEQLAQLDRAKTDFFSNISHEFRTPLTLILGPVEDALASPARRLQDGQLELVRRNALRLYKMVNTLLDFSRMEAGRAQATFVPIDLAAFTAQVASQFQSAIERAGLTYVIACRPLPEPTHVDPELWEKVVLNLLSNALKYTHRGEIRVELGAQDDQAVLTVRDTGVGIASDERDRVFERFFRARVTQGRSHEGTGIGLALVRELVRLHGGTVDVASALGEGSVFTVRIPRGAAHVPADRIEQTAHPRSPAAGAAPFVEEALRWSASLAGEDVPAREAEDLPALPPAIRAARILLVDDNADLRAYVAGLLAGSFATVATATDGRDALDQARRAPPDLVVSDVMMPVMDGFELVRALRADDRTRSIPIILLSARAGDDATVVGLESGADDYLVKPFSARELIARVRGQLELSRMRAEIWRERARLDELRRSMATRDEFVAVTSHELRTPLTALQLQVESLIERPGSELPPRVAAKLETARRQIHRLVRLTESLLAVSRVALDRLELHREDLELADLVRTVVARHDDEARGTGTSFALETAPARGRWDRASLEFVVDQLLANAVKFAPGTTVEVAVTASPGTAAITVRDAGPGIPADNLERIFARFERGVSTAHHGGVGVGLYLVRTLVDAHGGSVVARSAPGQGATFVVTLRREEGP